MTSVLFEQILLPSYIGNVKTIIDKKLCNSGWATSETLKRKNIIHLWSSKHALDNSIGINRLCDYIENYYF